MATAELIQDLLLRWEELREQGQDISPEQLCRERPELIEEVRRRIHALEAIHRLRPADPGATMPDTLVHDPAPPVGELPAVAGYEMLGELGRGGMGVVYKARQLGLNRLVALKMILSGAQAGSTERARFRTEAEAVARLQHPNVVQIYEVGEHEGMPFLCLELVDGVSLDKALAGQPQPPEEAARIVKTLAEAVQFAHEHGIIHRDLKPANVLLAASGLASAADPVAKPRAAVVPKISDFGLAKRLDIQDGPTQTGAVLGTPQYMAPEQAEGKIHLIGPATDVYALGSILYEMLTGRPPFLAATLLDLLEQVQSQEPRSPRVDHPGVPRDLEMICLKCLRKEPQQRYLAAQALADDLGRFLQGEPIKARSVPLVERVTRLLDRNPHLLTVGDVRPAILLSVAPVPFSFNLLLFLAAGHEAYYPLASLGGTGLLALMLGTLVLVFRRGIMPNVPTNLNRQLWSTRIGHVLGLILLPLVSYLTTPPDRAWNPMNVYPFWAVQAGVTMFTLGGAVWGRFYLLGLAVFVVAVLMALRLEWAALMLGGMLSIMLLLVGLALRRIVRESAAGPQPTIH
jgi:serine/threonine protein kinase